MGGGSSQPGWLGYVAGTAETAGLYIQLPAPALTVARIRPEFLIGHTATFSADIEWPENPQLPLD